MSAVPACAGSDNSTFLPIDGEKVFLCRSVANKVSQYCFRTAQRLNVRLAPLLASALPEEPFEKPSYDMTFKW